MTRPTVDQMAAAALARTAMTEEQRAIARAILANMREKLEREQFTRDLMARDAQKTTEEIYKFRRELGE